MKKFDKTISPPEDNQRDMIERLSQEPFVCDERLEAAGQDIAESFSIISSGNDVEEAYQERKKEGVNMSSNTVSYIFKWKPIAFAVFLFTLFLLLPIFHSHPRARRCLAMVSFVMVCWVSEAMPFFVTGLFIPLLTVLLKIQQDDDGENLPADVAAKKAFSHMFGDSVMLVLGGFAISAAFSKCRFEVLIARALQLRLGHRPRYFMLAFMLLGMFLSMWISNVAAPVLCTAVLLPIIHDLPRDSQYVRALLLGLAFACNIGGMLSPISSPQNTVSISYLNDAHPEYAISFFTWCSITIPFCIVCVLAIWGYLLVALKPDDVSHIPEIVFERIRLQAHHYIVLGTTLATILLWCSLSFSKPTFGSMGVVALFPLIILFGSGILTKNDLKGFSWNIILLLGGGSVLGGAVQ